MLVKKDEAKNNALLSHLKKINDHLANRNTRFLTGDTMCCFDCELMPRLQHIRVAGKYFVDFEIPVSWYNFLPLNPIISNHLHFCLYRPITLHSGGTCIICINWTHSHNHVRPIRILSITTNCNKCWKWRNTKSWKPQLSPHPFQSIFRNKICISSYRRRRLYPIECTTTTTFNTSIHT